MLQARGPAGAATITSPRLASEVVARLRAELAKVLVGQQALVDRLLIALLVGGHILLEGVPGLAKTLAARLLAQAVRATFHRIQFTPDLLPADLVGTEIYNPRTSEFAVRKGPVFTHILLADEINRAPAKVQSALLEAMQERQVTIGPTTLPLPDPFLVLATQNPIEQEGTYPLPEAQVDRFLMKVLVTYPDRDEEARIVEQMARTAPDTTIEPVLDPATILELRPQVDAVFLEEKVRNFILDVVHATRRPADFGLDVQPYIQLGASPRASIGLCLAGKAHALLSGRDYVVPHDIKAIGHDVLRHRLLVSFEGDAQNVTADNLLERIFEVLAVP